MFSFGSGTGAVVKVNFGNFPFLFDVESHRAEIRGDSFINPSFLRIVVLDYLLSRG